MPALGVGCVVLLIASIIGIYMGGKFLWGKAREQLDKAGVSMQDFQAHPERAAAKIFLSVNPDLEMVSEDKDAGTITVKIKSSGEVITVTYKDLAEGKIVFRDGKGQEFKVTGTGKDGGITMEGADGKTVIGTDVSPPPAWVPLHPSMTLMQGGMRSETADGVKGTSIAESTESLATLKTFYEDALKKSGFNSNASVSSGDDSAMLSGENAANKSSITIMLTKGEGAKSTVMIHYGGPK